MTEACARAATAADTRHALETVDELARWFDVDPLALKVETLSTAGATARDPESARQVALAAIALADEVRNRDELTKSLATTATTAARRARDAELVNRATILRRESERGAKKPGNGE